ncbi:hypothetical protein Apa02nite_064440 [Actinoplanes palleronii]|uniref:Uncharacterized protein n=1 Tax=Actinoplanes palleronii TaxID=113570 RepID=A0ABQ4BI19_9ACTN|nr:hypothetical protein Apa02nite_064440 [Actinoplanes palleronii]
MFGFQTAQLSDSYVQAAGCDRGRVEPVLCCAWATAFWLLVTSASSSEITFASALAVVTGAAEHNPARRVTWVGGWESG